MLPVPWIGAGTQKATRSANLGRGQGLLRGHPVGPSPWGGGKPCLPAEHWKNASPVGTGQSQVSCGTWALARTEPPGPTAPQALHSSPFSPGGGGHRRDLTERPGTCRPGCSHSAIALISENLQECSSDGITCNCSLLGKTKQTQCFLCQVFGRMGQLCWGGGFFVVILVFCFLIMFTIFLNHSVFYKDSTSSLPPFPHLSLPGC